MTSPVSWPRLIPRIPANRNPLGPADAGDALKPVAGLPHWRAPGVRAEGSRWIFSAPAQTPDPETAAPP